MGMGVVVGMMEYTGGSAAECPVEGCRARLTVVPHLVGRYGVPSRHIFDVELYDPDGRSWRSVCHSFEVPLCAPSFARLHAQTHG